METNKLKPFDLELAKAGEAVITRNKLNVEILDFEFNKEGKKIIAKIIYPKAENVLVRVFEDGKFWSNETTDDYDLFMKPETKIVWVNFYKGSFGGTIFCSVVYMTYQEAINGKNEMAGIFLETKIIEIEI